MLKKFVVGALVLLGVILLFIISIIAPIDYTPLNQLPEVTQTMHRLDDIKLETSKGNHELKVGWSRINITPEGPIDMAGYGPRGPYTAVADSLYSRTVVIDNGEKELVIISLDLLMFPRVVKQEIYKELQKIGYFKNEIYLTATHTHNGFGNWEKSFAGKLIFGEYNSKIVQLLAERIVAGVILARENKSTAEIGFQKIDARNWVTNRVTGENGTVDPFLRVIQIRKDNGHIGMIVSFSAHAVNLDADIWELSRDYPGILIDQLEANPTIDFAMFCAGMVASHNIKSEIPKSPKRIEVVGNALSEKILSNLDSVKFSSNTSLGGLDIDIELPPAQLRITADLRVRDWLFSALLGPLQADIKVMDIGDILLLGMPCDFSGELSVNNQLDQYAKNYGKSLFVTSFNGNYVGYITTDEHYATCQHDEVKTMNWVGPYKGDYFTDLTKKIIMITP